MLTVFKRNDVNRILQCLRLYLSKSVESCLPCAVMADVQTFPLESLLLLVFITLSVLLLHYLDYVGISI